jgi:(+)-trans-carveol dehydrogenase
MSNLEGKVALVTGAARGQGRSHCLKLAEAGADIIAIDAGAPDPTVTYAMPSLADLEETGELVRKTGRRAVIGQADVADWDQMSAAVDAGVAEFGRIDIVCANAGIFTSGEAWSLPEETWQRMLAVNLTGPWHAAKAAIPTMVEGGRGGSIIITGSTAATKGLPGMAHYAAAKHGVVGLMKTLAIELGPHRIRANVVAPTACGTPMLLNDEIRMLFGGGQMPSEEDFVARNVETHLIPTPWIQPEDVSDAVLFLASDASKFVTGTVLKVDAGFTTR